MKRLLKLTSIILIQFLVTSEFAFCATGFQNKAMLSPEICILKPNFQKGYFDRYSDLLNEVLRGIETISANKRLGDVFVVYVDCDLMCEIDQRGNPIGLNSVFLESIGRVRKIIGNRLLEIKLVESDLLEREVMVNFLAQTNTQKILFENYVRIIGISDKYVPSVDGERIYFVSPFNRNFNRGNFAINSYDFNTETEPQKIRNFLDKYLVKWMILRNIFAVKNMREGNPDLAIYNLEDTLTTARGFLNPESKKKQEKDKIEQYCVTLTIFARLCLYLDKPAKAQRIMARYSNIHQLDGQARDVLIDIYIKQGELEQAYYLISQMRAKPKLRREKNREVVQYPKVLILLIEKYLMLGDRGKAEEYYNEALRFFGERDFENDEEIVCFEKILKTMSVEFGVKWPFETWRNRGVVFQRIVNQQSGRKIRIDPGFFDHVRREHLSDTKNDLHGKKKTKFPGMEYGDSFRWLLSRAIEKGRHFRQFVPWWPKNWFVWYLSDDEKIMSEQLGIDRMGIIINKRFACTVFPSTGNSLKFFNRTEVKRPIAFLSLAPMLSDYVWNKTSRKPIGVYVGTERWGFSRIIKREELWEDLPKVEREVIIWQAVSNASYRRSSLQYDYYEYSYEIKGVKKNVYLFVETNNGRNWLIDMTESLPVGYGQKYPSITQSVPKVQEDLSLAEIGLNNFIGQAI